MCANATFTRAYMLETSGGGAACEALLEPGARCTTLFYRLVCNRRCPYCAGGVSLPARACKQNVVAFETECTDLLAPCKVFIPSGFFQPCDAGGLFVDDAVVPASSSSTAQETQAAVVVAVAAITVVAFTLLACFVYACTRRTRERNAVDT